MINCDIFTEEFLKAEGFKIISDDGQYGKAIDIRTNGMTVLYWNREGHSCTYFGDKLESNIGFAIRKDGDTRYAFNGYVYNQEDVSRILKLTW